MSIHEKRMRELLKTVEIVIPDGKGGFIRIDESRIGMTKIVGKGGEADALILG